MDRTVIEKKLDEAGLYYLTDEPMRKHTSFNIGGPADFYVVPKTVEQISACRKICESEAVPFTVIGNGSNVVFSDLGYRGVVMSTSSLTDEPQLVSAVSACVHIYRAAHRAGNSPKALDTAERIFQREGAEISKFDPCGTTYVNGADKLRLVGQ